MRPIEQVLIEIQDYLVPELDPWEQMLYHYLFRHTYLQGIRKIVIPARSVGPKLGKGRKGASELARNNIPKKLRLLEEKKAIKICSKSWEGTEVEIFLPHEIPGLITASEHDHEIDIETIDFFSTQENRQRITKRDGERCCYCLRHASAKEASIDHIDPQANGVNNSYRNLVNACFECNSKKHSQDAEKFLRENYRRGLLSPEEFEECVKYINQVRAGEIIPE